MKPFGHELDLEKKLSYQSKKNLVKTNILNVKLINKIFMENKIIENLEQLKKMLVLLSEERKVVLSHHKTFEHVEKMRAIVNESIEMANKQ